MNPIQKICMSISGGPINGLIDNELCPSISELFNIQDKDICVWDLTGSADRIEVHTHHDTNSMQGFERSAMKEAWLFYPNIVEPLVLDLMPAHMAFPRLPIQLFKTEESGEITVKENPYFSGNIDDIFLKATKLYLMLSFFSGFGSEKIRPKVIRKITLHPKDQTIEVDHTPDLSEVTFLGIQENLSYKISNSRQESLDHFLINFMPAMQFKSVHEHKVVIHEGQKCLQNVFEKGDWTALDRAKPLEESLCELSFEPISESCPAYISHSDRFERYSLSLLPHILNLDLVELTKQEEIPTLDWDSFLKSGSGMALVSLHRELLLNLFSHGAMNLGELLDAYTEVNSASNH
jgi:hypothetical protein